MTKQAQNDTRKKMGRPATGQGTPVMVRLQPDLLAWVDAERAKFDPVPSRPELIRKIIEEHIQRTGEGGL